MTKPAYFATRSHLLVCTGESCSARGAREVFAGIWQRLEHEGLAYYKTGGSVRLTEAGCLGACNFGPNATLYVRNGQGELEEAWYSGVTATDLVEVARAAHEVRALPAKGRYDR